MGRRQAEQLVDLLTPLQIEHVYSSPYVRSVQTATPFARTHGLDVTLVDDLRERLLACGRNHNPTEIWHRSWEDFGFALPGCETATAAQARICAALHEIAARKTGTIGVFSHGHVIALFLRALDPGVGRKEAELLTNPDVLKLEWNGEAFTWHREFRMPGLADITTHHLQTPIDED